LRTFPLTGREVKVVGSRSAAGYIDRHRWQAAEQRYEKNFGYWKKITAAADDGNVRSQHPIGMMTELRVDVTKVELSVTAGELCLRFANGVQVEGGTVDLPPPKYRTVAQIAERTQYCEKTIRNWINREGCPARRISGDIRLLDHEVDEWIAKHKIGGH